MLLRNLFKRRLLVAVEQRGSNQNACRTLSDSSQTSASCHQNEETASNKRLNKIALVGAPNAGKSTLLNKLIRCEISSVSSKVHTTRRNTLGVYSDCDTQLEFYDSPGIVDMKHGIKHQLEQSMLHDSDLAAEKCDLITVLVDVSNVREQRRLNKGVLRILSEHPDKRSVLVMNKVDLVKDKRTLLDVAARLTQGCLDGRLIFSKKSLKHLTETEIKQLNLSSHFKMLDSSRSSNDQIRPTKIERPMHKHVIELDPKHHDELDEVSKDKPANDPDSIGYKRFSHVFSISALNDDGVDELREYMISIAQPVVRWPHGPDYLTNLSANELVHEMIRGKVMDHVEKAIPYLLKYKYLACRYDETGSLHIQLELRCPESYMVGKVIGEKGTIMFRIIEDSREAISRSLGCDVRIAIEVIGPKKVKESKANAR